MATMNRLPRCVPAVVLLLTIISAAQARYSGGTGEPNEPYQIATAEDLMLLGETPEDYFKHFILTADIDLDPNLPGRKVFDRAVIAPDTSDTQSGFQGTPFMGVFDGNGHTISHLTIRMDPLHQYLGLFGQLGMGWFSVVEVKDLGLVDVDITGGYAVGGLVGLNACGNITNSYSDGLVSGVQDVGGLVGANGDYPRSGGGRVVACHSTCAVTGIFIVGGLVGNSYGDLVACYSTGSVSAVYNVGGLAGNNSGSIAASYSAGSVSGEYAVGGLVSSGSNIASSFWDIQTSGQTTSLRGMGLTTAEMMDPQVLALNGWANDPNWVLDGGRDYPRLAWEKTPGSVIPEANMDWLAGQGTPDSPYRIDTAEQLILLGKASILWDSHFVLGADIDLDFALPGRQIFGQAVIPVFTGVFDGGGHVISHLTIQGTWNLGLFGRLDSGAEVSDLGVVDVNIVGSGDHVGGLAGSNDGTIVASYSTGSVSGMDGVGGLVGNNGMGRIVNCYSSGSVSGTSYVGGLVGIGGSIISSYSSGSVSATSYVGGLVSGGGSINSSLWDIQTSGQMTSVGGMGLTTAEMMDPQMLGLNGWANDPNWVLDAGRDYPRLAWQGTPGEIIPEPNMDWLAGRGTPDSPYRIDTAEQLILLSKASILWDSHFVLGADIDLDPALPGRQIFGQAVIPVFTGVFDGGGHVISHLTVQGTWNLGLFGRLDSGAEVSDLGVVDVNIVGSGDYVGSLAGSNGGTISNSYSSGVVSGTGYIGGLVGFNWSQVTACCSAAGVSGGRDVGGLIGCNVGQVTDCYSIGSVSGDSSVGGLVGTKMIFQEGRLRVPPAIGTATSCFWDIQTSGQATSDGGTGKTTAEMQTASTFLDAGWDFVGETGNGTEDIWWILEGKDYPRLWWELIAEN